MGFNKIIDVFIYLCFLNVTEAQVWHSSQNRNPGIIILDFL